jgi:RNA polymerase sigma-70 factor, ECF subfamily
MNAPAVDERDAQDMARLVEGCDAALNDLMERHGEKLFNYLIRSLQDESDAADLAQESFVRVYQNRSKFNPSQKFTTWLYAIASNLVRDRYRWRSRHPQVSLDAESDQTAASLKDILPNVHEAPDQNLETEERAEAVRKAVASLPEELRLPLILSVYQELPQAEIAAIVNCSVKAVETRIYRAKQRLRAGLAELVQSL